MNAAKTTLLLAGLTVLLVLIAGMLGGPRWAVIGLVVATVMNFASYWFSDRIVLAMYRAKPVTEDEAPRLHAMVDELCARAGLPKPRLYVIPTEAANAFATGRNPQHAAVAVTAGIVNLLTEEELKGVLAHELAHVGNRDILIGSIAATVAGAVMMVASMARWAMIFGGSGGDDRDGGNPIVLLLAAIFAPIAAMVIQMSISRTREYKADATGARWAGPQGLASALRKLEQASQRAPMPAHPSSAHLFITKPGMGSFLGNLFSTHPPMEKRIQKLMEMTA